MIKLLPLGMRQIPRIALLTAAAAAPLVSASFGRAGETEHMPIPAATRQNMLGADGKWAAAEIRDPPGLSFRQQM